MKGMPIFEALSVSALGIAIVLIELAALAICIVLISKLIGAFVKGKSPVAAPSVVVEQSPVVATTDIAPDQINLYNVNDETAAMIMAIVADKLQKPINELYFKSIREI